MKEVRANVFLIDCTPFQNVSKTNVSLPPLWFLLKLTQFGMASVFWQHVE